MKFPKLLIAGFTICSLGSAVQAQAPLTPAAPLEVEAETPEGVASRYMEAMRSKDLKTCAALMHPDALKQLKQLFRPLVTTTQGPELGVMFFNVRTPVEFERLTGEQAFERLMNSVIKLSPEVASAMKSSKFTIIGHVLEANDTAHVVYRMTAVTKGITVTKLSVMPFKKHGLEWRGLLTGDIEGMAAALSGTNPARSTAKPAKPTVKKTPAKSERKPQPK